LRIITNETGIREEVFDPQKKRGQIIFREIGFEG